jgi:hypothetical protein
VTVISPDSLIVQAAEAETSTVTIRNDGADAVTLNLRVDLGKGTATVKPSRVTVKGFRVTAFQLTIRADKSDRDTTGALVLSAADAPPSVLPLTIEPKQNDYAAAALIFAPLLLGIVLVGGCVLIVDVQGPFGPANWDYSESWATSLTLVGALLGTVLGAGVLPDKLDLFSKAGYSGFNVLFGMLVLVAPLVYVAAQRRIKGAVDKTPQYHGTTWAFGLASVATLWGVFGELATVGLLFREIEKAGGLGTALVLVSWAILGVIVLVAIAYSWKRMRLILESPPAAEGTGVAGPDTAGAWSLL